MDDDTNEVVLPKPKKDPIGEKFYGRWRIVHVPELDRETIDEEVPAFIEVHEGSAGRIPVYLCAGRHRLSLQHGRREASMRLFLPRRR